MAYAADRTPQELTALTSLASDDTIIVGDTSDVSEVAKSITKANLEADLTITASQVSDFDTEVANNSAVTANTAKVSYTDAAKVATIETNADVTDTANVTAAGALMDSEVTNLAQVKAFDSTDYATAAQGALAASASQPGHTHVATDVTDFDTAVAANSAVAANTAKVTNATHTGDVTGATALTIANSAVTLAKMANLAQDQFIGRTTASTGVPQTATITAAARTVLDDTTTAAMATTLGLGTGSSPQFTAVNIGNATDTTITRTAAGTIAVEGNVLYRAGGPDVPVTDGGTGASDAATARTNLGAAPTASPTFTGTTATDLVTYDAARGKVTAGGNLSTTETINFNDETNYTGNLDANITFTFASATSGDDVTLYLTYSGAQRTITWPTITWLDNATGAAPTTPAASGNVLVVTVRYIGTTYYASATGNYAVYA